MMRGTVTASFQAALRLKVQGPAGQEQEVEGVIDTGYNGGLGLPPALIAQLGLPWSRRARALLADGSESIFDIFDGIVIWDGKQTPVSVDEAAAFPLIGMALLESYELRVEVRPGGQVTLQALP